MDKRRKILIASASSNLLFLQSVVTATRLQMENDTSSDSEGDAKIMEMSLKIRGSRRKAVRIRDFVDKIVPEFNTKQFKEHFRMKPSASENLQHSIGARLSTHSNISVRKQLLLVTWLS